MLQTNRRIFNTLPLLPKNSTMQKSHKFIEIHRLWPAIRKNNLILLEIQFTRQVS